MGFIRIPGLKGKVYVPGAGPACPKKHPCRDCFSCEHCSDDRCRVCRNESVPGDKQKREENTGNKTDE